MKKTWVIENNVMSVEDQTRFVKAVEKSGNKVFVANGTDIIENANNFSTRCIFYGTINTSLLLRNKSIQVWNQGFDCNKYYPFIDHDKLLNGDYFMVTYANFMKNADYYFEKENFNNLFVRPNSGLKQFTGFVISPFNYESEMKSIVMFPEEIILVSRENRYIKDEWRLLVVSHAGEEPRVVTGSQYISNKRIVSDYNDYVPQQVIDFAQEVAKCIPGQYPAWTIDICNVSSRNEDKIQNLQVVEINSFSTAGLYGMDFDAAVKEISDSLESYL